MKHPASPPEKPVLAPQQKTEKAPKFDTAPPVAVRAVPVGTDLSIWIKRNDMVDLLGCSSSTILNYVRRGVLRQEYDYRHDAQGISRRTAVYHPDDVKKIKARLRRTVREHPDDLGARAFDLFRAGQPLEAIVSTLRATPEEVERLYDKWLDLGGARLMITSAAKEELARIVGPFDSVAGLIEQIVERFGVPDAGEAGKKTSA